MEIELLASYSVGENLNTVRFGDNQCPHCGEDIYINKNQKQYIEDNAWELVQDGERKKYPCTCPHCDKEINLVIENVMMATFDIEE